MPSPNAKSPVRYVQTGTSRATFARVICEAGENLEPPASCAYAGHSIAGRWAGIGRAEIKAPNVAHITTPPFLMIWLPPGARRRRQRRNGSDIVKESPRTAARTHGGIRPRSDRKSTRLNSSHVRI